MRDVRNVHCSALHFAFGRNPPGWMKLIVVPGLVNHGPRRCRWPSPCAVSSVTPQTAARSRRCSALSAGSHSAPAARTVCLIHARDSLLSPIPPAVAQGTANQRRHNHDPDPTSPHGPFLEASGARRMSCFTTSPSGLSGDTGPAQLDGCHPAARVLRKATRRSVHSRDPWRRRRRSPLSAAPPVLRGGLSATRHRP